MFVIILIACMRVIAVFFFVSLVLVFCQEGILIDRGGLWEKIDWCTISPAEQRKCVDLQNAIAFAFAQKTVDVLPLLSCISRRSTYQCMRAIEAGEADVMTAEAGDMFTAARWHGLVPIAMEEYGGASVRNSVVVVRRNLSLTSLQDLQGKRLCSTGAGTMSGWIIPTTVLLRQSTAFRGDDKLPGTIQLNVTDCNNLVKTLSEFLGPSCVPGILDFRHNQRSNNPDKLCQACTHNSDLTTWCSSGDSYAGNDGVLNCMVHGVGEVGFMSAHVALQLPPQTAALFDFICPDGKTVPLSPQTVCSWGGFPGNTFLTSSAKSELEKPFLQKFLFNLTQTASRMFSDREPITGEKRYVGSDLMWSDTMTSLRILRDSEQRLPQIFSRELYEAMQGNSACPYSSMRLCVVGREELDKCLSFQLALQSRNLRPLLVCVQARNHWDCMQRISSEEADVMVADAADSLLAEELYGLQPFLVEIHDQNEPYFYAVAVAKKMDPTTTLLDLRGRRTCHGAIYSGVGWSVPISFLITQNRVRDAANCDDLTYQVGQMLEKACAPGALTTAHFRSVQHAENLCDLCMGDISDYCARNPGEPYYGATGAFKCLAEGGGQVAFVMHHTAWWNTDGRNQRMWARALVSDDYELLCVDGTRAPIRSFADCNLGRVPNNVVMTSRRKSEEEISAYISLMDYAQDAFGSSSNPDFRMFRSEGHVNQDLIFRDTTTRLVPIAVENQSAVMYLGEDFIRIVRRTQCSHATWNAGNASLCYPSFGFLLLLRLLK